MSLGDSSNAVQHYLKAAELFDSIRDHINQARSLNNARIACLSLKQYDEAVKVLRQCLAARRRIGDPDGEARTLNIIGIAYGAWSHYERAIDYSHAALEQFEKAHDSQGVQQTLMNLGNVYLRQGHLMEAADDYSRAFAQCQGSVDSRTKVSILQAQALAYHRLGDYGRARAYYVKASTMATRTGDRYLRDATLTNLGGFYTWWNQFEKAQRCYREVLVSIRLQRNWKRTALMLTSMGKVELAQGNFQRAIGLWKQAAEAYRTIGMDPTTPKDLIANAYMDLGEVRKAEAYVNQLQCPATLGRFLLAKSKYREARDVYGRILKKAENDHHTNALFISCTGLGVAHEGLDNFKTSETFFRRAVRHASLIRETVGITAMAKLSEGEAGGFRIAAPAEGLVRVLTKEGRPVQALMESDQIKSEQFSRYFQNRPRKASFGLTKTALEKENSHIRLMSVLMNEQDRAYKTKGTRLVQTLNPRIQSLRYQMNSHRQALKRQSSQYGSTRYPEKVQDLLSRLKDDQWVLVYEVTDTATITYLLRGKSLVKSSVLELPRRVLQCRVNDFRDPLDMESGSRRPADKLKSFDFRTGKKLFDELVAPVLSDLPAGAHVVIVPDDCLHLVPFEALSKNDKGQVKSDRRIPCVVSATFFGDRNPLSYCQCVASIPSSSERKARAGSVKKLLTVADPVFRMTDPRVRGINASHIHRTGSKSSRTSLDSRVLCGTGCKMFRRLPLTSNLAHFLTSLYGDDVDTLTGLGATKDNFLNNPEVPLDSYRALLFATHGYFGSGIPGIMEPVLVLTIVPPGTDGFLKVSEIMSLSLNADIVVAAACRTALGKIVPGLGVVGMGRAFQFAGARSSLMTLWSIAEKPSVMFVESFFTHVKAGRGKVESLMLARNHLRKNGYDHPFFWAPFILVGDARSSSPDSANW